MIGTAEAMKDLRGSEGPGSEGPVSVWAGLVAATGPADGFLTLPGILIGLAVAAALGGWVGWALRSGRARSHRRAEEAWESEIVRAAGCARDRAIGEKEQLDECLDRLRAEHGHCEEKTEALITRLRDREAAVESLKRDLAAAVEATQERAERVRALDRRVEELEESIHERYQRNGMPDWLLNEPDGAVDDLTAIRGLGEVTEERLNELGIYRYRQLAQMTPDNARWIGLKIHVVPGRILRDRWAEQPPLISPACARSR
jgi:predicted flap endonuclease-1-like 5' DNA nuclease